MSYRTNTRTKKVFPISGTTRPSLDDIISEKSQSTQKQYLKFLTDRLNTIAPRPIGSGPPNYSPNPERYNGWYNRDTWETYLILSNEETTQRWLDSWRANWQRKIKNGTFVPEAAEYAVWKYMVPVAQGKSGPVRSESPDPDIDRSQVAYREIVDAILEE